MDKELKTLTENIASSRNWLRHDFTPSPPVIEIKSINGKTTYQRPDGVFLLLIFDGCGKIDVDAHIYEIRKGSCFILYYYNFYRFILNSGETIQYCRVTLSQITYMLASSLPGQALLPFELADEPIQITLSDKEFDMAETLIRSIMSKNKATDKYTPIYECLARLARIYNRVPR